LKLRQKPYSNAGIFLPYIRTILLPYSDIFPGLAVLSQEIAVLLMTRYSAHISDDVIRIPTEARANVVSFAPDTTQVFQLVDLTLFGVLKRCPRYELPLDENEAPVKAIAKVYHDSADTIVLGNVCRAFRACAFEFGMTRERYDFLFDEVKLRKSAGFRESRSVTFPWTSYRGHDVLLSSVGSRNLSKST
jgi:hypothetical protein